MRYTQIKGIEAVGPAFADLVKRAHDKGAEIFAADLACNGATPESVEMMADRWESEMQPTSFADELRDFASQVRVVIEAS